MTPCSKFEQKQTNPEKYSIKKLSLFDESVLYLRTEVAFNGFHVLGISYPVLSTRDGWSKEHAR